MLARQVQGAIMHSLRCLELLGLVEVTYPRPKIAVVWLAQPRGLLEIYADLPCPYLPVKELPEPESPEPAREWRFTSYQEILNKNLPALARSLMPVSEVLSSLKIDVAPWAELSGMDVPAHRSRGRKAGLDLLLENDGYLGIFPRKDADETLRRRNAERIERLAGVVRDLYRALNHIERAVGPGAVAERVRVTREDQRDYVTVDGMRYDVTGVYGADKVFGLLREADGDFVPGSVIGQETGQKQFKPKAFKEAVTKISHRLGSVIDSVTSAGTRIVLPLPPH